MGELRGTARYGTAQAGQIVFSSRSAPVDCTVRNLSQGGACLEVEKQDGIPASFELVLDADRSSRRCDVAWRSGNQIGVTFSSQPSPDRTKGGVDRIEKRTEFAFGISGFIESDGQAELVPCKVLDLSASGAKIHLLAACELGESFRLKLSRTGEPRHCKLKWKAGDVVGVSITK